MFYQQNYSVKDFNASSETFWVWVWVWIKNPHEISTQLDYGYLLITMSSTSGIVLPTAERDDDGKEYLSSEPWQKMVRCC